MLFPFPQIFIGLLTKGFGKVGLPFNRLVQVEGLYRGSGTGTLSRQRWQEQVLAVQVLNDMDITAERELLVKNYGRSPCLRCREHKK